MTCAEARQNFSLYLYGELDFSTDELLEQHVAECAECESALTKERQWHESVAAASTEVPIDLLAKCREDLRDSLSVVREARQPAWIRWLDSLGFRSNSWSMRLATASLLVCLGFGLSRLLERHGLPNPGIVDGFTSEMNLLDPVRAHVRLIEPSGDNRVQLVVDEVREHIVSGSLDDSRVRRLLLAASKDPTDPTIRVDSVEMLKDVDGDDVREALFDTAQHDPNAGVRLKAIEALGRFANDSSTRRTLLFVLSHDESPDVRTQAIDMLVAPETTGNLSPQLADALQSLMRSDPDQYVRMRCRQALKSPHRAVPVY
jgi:HEAT repeat protein/putative zinc finger protein